MMQSELSNMIDSLCTLVWGDAVSDEIFERWSQGFDWSADEHCALIQNFGGPCAIIAPIQAYFLKNLLFEADRFEDNLPVLSNINLHSLSDSKRKEMFIKTLHEVLSKMNSNVWFLCICDNCLTNEESQADSSHRCSDKSNESSFKPFHSNIKFVKCDSKEDLLTKLNQNYQQFTSQFGVIKFLYSMLISKGTDAILEEMDIPRVELIDPTYGYGSQNLINLFLCGQAVSNVFDNDRIIDGLRLRGIPHICDIGFLTLLERLRYCTVGSLLKRPRYPIWLIGSETHLSLIFSLQKLLVLPESDRDIADKIFDKYDPEDKGYISCSMLGDLMREMNLVCDPEYVGIMMKTIDPEDLGIIVRSEFFKEFFSDEDLQTTPEMFELYHYNGLSQSSFDNTVRFRKGKAKLNDWQENSATAADSTIESCLQMRWAGVWITWEDGPAPSLN